MLRYILPFTRYPYRGARVDCPVCGSADHHKVAGRDRKAKWLATHICRACGLFFTNPMPTEAELADYYATTYRLEYQFASIKPRASHVSRKAAEAAVRAEELGEVVNLSRPLRFLDFGTGSGELPKHMATLGHEATGFEPGESFVEYARAQAEGAGTARILTGCWQDMDFAPGSFDVITCLHVLEHLPTPVAALSQLREWLAPGGVIFLEVPDMQAYHPKGPIRFHFAHVLGFSHDNLALAAEKAGLACLLERSATSVFLVHVDDERAKPAVCDLAATARRNETEYTERAPLGERLIYHVRRTARVLARELKLNKG